ncbi:MAG TPA: cellulose biosynthesis protein BcsN [Rhodoblastus sp.]|nr:cellulose biosynthesis protein BcsN [Rhodoblastus sp.]
MTPAPTFLALSLLAALAGCNARSERQPNLDMMALAAAAPSAAPPRAAPLRDGAGGTVWARLPAPAGAVKTTRQRRHPNGFSQDIALGSDVAAPDSHVTVAIQNGPPIESVNKAPVWKPGESGIAEELAREFPGMRMEVVANGGYSNRYGRFGLAIGRRGENLRCIYAWQYIDDARKNFGDGARIQLDGADSAPAAIRIKLCRADATIDQLVGAAKNVVIDIPPDFGVVAAQSASRTAAPRHAAAPHAPRKYRRAPPQTARVGDEPPSYWTPDVGPRYLAPVDSPLAAGPAARPASGGQIGAKFGADLPPQAFQGPRPAAAPAQYGVAGAPTIAPLPN